VKLQLQLFLISTLDGRDWSVSLPGRLPIGRCRLCALDTRLDGPSTSLDTLEGEKNILPLAVIEPLLLFFDILLTVHLNIFILMLTDLMH